MKTTKILEIPSNNEALRLFFAALVGYGVASGMWFVAILFAVGVWMGYRDSRRV
jgi:uncharacterized membrane protein